MQQPKAIRLLTLVIILSLVPLSAFGATKKKRTSTRKTVTSTTSKRTTTAAAKKKKAKARPASHLAKTKKAAPIIHSSRRRPKKRFYSPWKEPTYADSTSSDYIDGEDLTVRRAAVDALGPFNGSVVVVDPHTGRILTMVNQKLALKNGFQPCSTIKIVAALAGLNEGVIERNTMLPVYRRARMGLTEALARSNNLFFARIGEALGYDRVSYYARQFGLGEKAGLDIPGEEAGTLPDSTPRGGMGMMTSFGEGITLTPLQLAAIMASIANDGTLYYLQYPRSQEAAANLVPRVKRRLDIERWIPDVKPGMMGAVEYGTARRASYAANEPILGKTGTCTDYRSPTHMGWFGSFNDVGKNKLVVVVMLTGGYGVSGPVASGIAGRVYRNLSNANYYEQDRPVTPVALVSSGCCTPASSN